VADRWTEQVPDTWESIHAKGGETGGY